MPFFLPQSAPPQKRQVKNAETGFMQWPSICLYRKQWEAKGKISIDMVKVKGRSENFKNMFAVYIKGIRHTVFDTLFLCQCPFKETP
jgi:hypothetical protein